MNDKNLVLINPSLPTITLSTGETVYAGRDRKSDPFRPMRYGNQKQAEARLSAIQPTLEATGKKGAVVKQGNRFLIFVYGRQDANVSDIIPDWLLSEEERDERDRRDTDAVNRLNELDARNHVENPNHDYEGPMGIFEDYEGIDSGQETSSPSLPIRMDNTPNDLSRFKFWDEKPELPEVVPTWSELGMTAEQYCTPVVSDPHRQTASEVFSVPESDVTDEPRRAAKTINYGAIYGRQDENWLMDDLDYVQTVDRERLCGTPDLADLETGGTYELKIMEPVNRRVSSRESNFVPSRSRLQGPGKIFATVNGEHINPRNRHNQNDSAKQHVIVSNPPSRLSSLEPANISSSDPLKAEILRRQRLKYKLTGGRFGV